MSIGGVLLKVFVGLPLMVCGQVLIIPAIFDSAIKYFNLGLTNLGSFIFGIIMLFFGLGILMFADDLVGCIKIKKSGAEKK